MMSEYFLFAQLIASVFGRFDINVWIIGSLLLIIAILIFFNLSRSLEQMKKNNEVQAYIETDNVQFDLVLKAMKLSIWSLDVKTHKVYYGDDYREHVDNFVPIPGTTFETHTTILHSDDAERVNKALFALCDGSSDYYHEQYRVMLPHTGGRFYWAESYATVSERDDNGNPTTVVGTTMRIDERKNMETALITARNKAEEANKLKSAFLANMNHEIRTPLNSMSGYAQVLLNYDISEEERKKCLRRIIDNSESLAHLLNTMMELSSTEAGKNALRKEPIDVNLLFRNIVEKFININKNSNIQILSYLPKETCTINSDKNAISSICGHFIANALKFTIRGTITLGYNILPSNRICIWVRDTGKGIAEEDSKRIFDSFVKLDEFVQGAGLGLSVCKNIVSNMEGSIGVESKVGRGSTFWFEIQMK